MVIVPSITKAQVGNISYFLGKNYKLPSITLYS